MCLCGTRASGDRIYWPCVQHWIGCDACLRVKRVSWFRAAFTRNYTIYIEVRSPSPSSRLPRAIATITSIPSLRARNTTNACLQTSWTNWQTVDSMRQSRLVSCTHLAAAMALCLYRSLNSSNANKKSPLLDCMSRAIGQMLLCQAVCVCRLLIDCRIFVIDRAEQHNQCSTV